MVAKLKGATREWPQKERDPPFRLGPCMLEADHLEATSEDLRLTQGTGAGS